MAWKQLNVIWQINIFQKHVHNIIAQSTLCMSKCQQYLIMIVTWPPITFLNISSLIFIKHQFCLYSSGILSWFSIEHLWEEPLPSDPRALEPQQHCKEEEWLGTPQLASSAEEGWQSCLEWLVFLINLTQSRVLWEEYLSEELFDL